MKRILSLILVISMVLSLGAVTAFADDTPLNVGYFAKVSVTQQSGAPATAGAGGSCGWRIDPGHVNDGFIHTDLNYWGYLYSVTPSELPLNVDFDFRDKEVLVDTVRLVQGNRGADNKGRYTKIQLQYYNGYDWENIPVEASGAISVSGDDITLNWETPTSTETYSALNQNISLDTIDIKLSAPLNMADCRVKILEAVGSGDINGEFAIDEIELLGAWAKTQDAPELFAIKGVSNAEKFPTAENIALAKERVAALSDDALKAKLEKKIDVLTQWQNLAIDASASAGIGSAADINNGVDWEQGWTCQKTADDDKKYLKLDYGKTVTIKRIDLSSMRFRGSVKKADIYAVNGGEEEKVGSFTSTSGFVPERQYFDFNSQFGKDAKRAFEEADVYFLGDSITDLVRKAKIFEYDLPSAVVCDALKIVITYVEAPWGDFSVGELKTWGFEGAERQYEKVNLAFNAQPSAYLEDGTIVNGGVDAHPQRCAITAINNYDIDGAGGWYTYILPLENLPVYVELDYGTDITELTKFTIAALNTGYGLSKFEMEMFDGKQWNKITPAASQPDGVTVSGNMVSLDWKTPSRTETNSSGSRTQYFMDVNFAAPATGLKFRIKILEAVGSGDHWGMLPIPEIMTYGYNPTQADLTARTDADELFAKLAPGMAAAAVNFATEKNINAAKRAVKNMPDGAEKAALNASLSKLKAYTNVASEASATSGMGKDAAKVNDGLFGAGTDGWDSSSTAINENSWVELNYGKNMKIGKLEFTNKYFPSSVKTVDIYAKINGEYVLVKENADVKSSHVPEISWYGGDKTPFEKEALTYLDTIGAVREDKNDYIFAKFTEVKLDTPVVCSAVKVLVKAAETAWGGYGITELRTWGYQPSDDELSLSAGNYRMYSGTEINGDNLITAPVAGNVTLACDIDNMSVKEQKCTLIACVYKNNKLTAISVSDLGSIPAGTSVKDKSVTVNVPDADGAKVKIMVWDSFGAGGLSPLAEGKEF